MMQANELLATRVSNGKLQEPAPDEETMNAIFRDALRAPDHGILRPWRLLTIRGEAALSRLGDVYAHAMQTRQPEVAEATVERVRRKPLRAPLVVVVVATPTKHPKAPEIEQVLSAGAVAHGILLGLWARGFSGMWRTGPMAYSPQVKASLGLRQEDHIVAFLYVGTASAPPPKAVRPDPAKLVSAWPPAG